MFYHEAITQSPKNPLAIALSMQTDIILEYQGKTLIIDAKYYDKTMQTQFDKHTQG